MAIAAMLLLLAQAMTASVPMLHPAPAQQSHHAHGKHDCCPKPVVKMADCCPRAVACPHQDHGAGACCCAESGETAVPSRIQGSVSPLATATAPAAQSPKSDVNARSSSPDQAPLDNSPPVLVLRN